MVATVMLEIEAAAVYGKKNKGLWDSWCGFEKVSSFKQEESKDVGDEFAAGKIEAYNVAVHWRKCVGLVRDICELKQS